MSAEAKAIYEALLENGRLHAVELRQKAHMANDTAKYKFEKTITELQVQLKVLPVGIAAAGAWKYAFIYDIVPRYYPDLQERARPISRREAQRKLVLRHLNNVVAGSRSDVFKALDVLGWTRAEFDSAIAMMIERDDIYELATSGRKEPLLVSKRT